MCPSLSTLTPFVWSITLGIVVILFFQCIGALVDPANNIGRGVKWGLVAHTTALFLFLMIPTALDLYQASIEFIDNRSFPGTEEIPAPGPIGYVVSLNLDPVTIVFITMFPLNQWLADGLLVISISNPSLKHLTRSTSPVIPLFYYLFHELLGHGLPEPDVPRLCWYVLNFLAGRWQHRQLTLMK